MNKLCHKCAREQNKLYDLIYGETKDYICSSCGATCYVTFIPDKKQYTLPPIKWYERQWFQWSIFIIMIPFYLLLLVTNLFGANWDVPYPKGEMPKDTD